MKAEPPELAPPYIGPGSHSLTLYKISVRFSDVDHYRTILGQISEAVVQCPNCMYLFLCVGLSMVSVLESGVKMIFIR